MRDESGWSLWIDPPEPCECCGELHALRDYIPVRYLPMDCPACGRHRLEYDGVHVRCEKCGTCDWEHPANAAREREGGAG